MHLQVWQKQIGFLGVAMERHATFWNMEKSYPLKQKIHTTPFWKNQLTVNNPRREKSYPLNMPWNETPPPLVTSS